MSRREAKIDWAMVRRIRDDAAAPPRFPTMSDEAVAEIDRLTDALESAREREATLREALLAHSGAVRRAAVTLFHLRAHSTVAGIEAVSRDVVTDVAHRLREVADRAGVVIAATPPKIATTEGGER